MTTSPDEIKRKIESIDFTISLLKKERRLLRKNLYLKNDLNYFIVDAKKPEPNPDNFEYKLAKQIWSCYAIGKPFIKELCAAKDNFVYSTEHLNPEEKNSLINLCQTMSNQGWLEFNQFKSGVETTPKLSGINKNFLNGGWMESANRYLINKTLHSFANEKRVKCCNVFWNIKLKEIGSEENHPDMELDIVVELDERFYIFETKSGMIDFKKMRDMANLLDTEKSRFIVCSSDENQSSKKHSQCFLIPLPQLETKLKKLLAKGFTNESIAE